VTARAALVTGASAGIGLAVSRLLSARGYGVTMVARDAQRLRAAALPQALTVSADAADDGAVEAALRRHLERWGRLDVVAANAGTGSGGTVASTRPHHLERMLRTNVGALFTLARLAMPALREAGAEHRGAWFVVTASISGVRPAGGFAAYSASKAAALSVARSVDVEEAANGVRACALCPAFVETAMTEWARDSVPAGAMLQPEDVAAAVGFLLDLSPNARVTEIVMGRTGASWQEP
jgi:NADP-dependent 3-hydroxy acid dehydrogenase YdfG